MKKAIVVYDSIYGNTEKVARALAQGLENSGTVKAEVIRADIADATRISDYDMIIIGAPTHAWKPSQKAREFLGRLDASSLRGKKGFAFDTKYRSRLAGSAAKKIQSTLSKLGAEIVTDSVSAIVTGSEGPLEKGTEEKFTDIGFKISRLI
jgi:flavorubredoxin